MAEVEMIEGGVCAVQGVFAGGKKVDRDGASLISGDGKAVAVFTKNRLQAAHIPVTREHIASGKIAGVLVTSGNANCATGEKGLHDARQLCEAAGTYLRVPGTDIALASTGLIGKHVDMSVTEPLIGIAFANLSMDTSGATAAAEAMMTTDTKPKLAAAKCGEFTVGGVAKGSGMIGPKMGTMIAVLYTDAHIAKRILKKELITAVDETFNMVVVDGDTSPNDTVLLVSTGRKKGALVDFQQALHAVCRELAIDIASDGEGAAKLLVASVKGAETREGARRCARAIVSSPLVKTAVAGGDPNFGRVLSAAGNSLENLPLEKLKLSVGNGNDSVTFFEGGSPVSDAAAPAAALMQGERVEFTLELGTGEENATAWGCDMTEEYVTINARYST
jgi:glutamate N-acetyltransferase/amino-acid N-acetyltransferase